MSKELEEVSAGLIAQLSYSERGPQRNGVFALWLVVNTCTGILGNHSVQGKNQRKRVVALRKRLSSLSLPVPLRKAISVALHDLSPDSQGSASTALEQLVVSARETVNADCGKLIEAAAQRAATFNGQAQSADLPGKAAGQ